MVSWINLNFFVLQFANESELVEYYLSELTVFNDADDKEFEEEESEAERYLEKDLMSKYFIFKGVANGNVGEFIKLYYEISRLDVIQMYAFNITYKKEQYNAERRRHGR
jgi:hypothetical protein